MLRAIPEKMQRGSMNNACDKREYRHKWDKIGPSHLLSEYGDLLLLLLLFLFFSKKILGREHSSRVSKRFIGNF